jgi:FixJ family two-component response regulator
VIDDDHSMRRSLKRLLKFSAWDVRTFDSAEAFLSELPKLAAGYLVVDIQLPGMSGLELLQHLRSINLAWPTLAMSASIDPSVEGEALRLGAALFLRKPFDPQVLLDFLAQSAPALKSSRI